MLSMLKRNSRYKKARLSQRARGKYVATVLHADLNFCATFANYSF